MQYLGAAPSPDQAGIHPAYAGDDHRVLVMQITTAGDISGQMTVTVYPNGELSSAGTNLATFDSNSACLNLDPCVDADEDGICDDVDEQGIGRLWGAMAPVRPRMRLPDP